MLIDLLESSKAIGLCPMGNDYDKQINKLTTSMYILQDGLPTKPA